MEKRKHHERKQENQRQETVELEDKHLENVAGGAGEQDAPRESELDKGSETTGGVGDKGTRKP